MTDELTYWMATGLIAVVAVVLFKLLAVKAGGRIPALADLAAFI